MVALVKVSESTLLAGLNVDSILLSDTLQRSKIQQGLSTMMAIWNEKLIHRTYSSGEGTEVDIALEEFARAMFISAGGKHASDWLKNHNGFAPNMMTDAEARIALKIRIGANLMTEETWSTHNNKKCSTCKKNVIRQTLLHAVGTCAKRNGFKIQRHELAKHALNKSIRQSGGSFMTQVEPRIDTHFALKPNVDSENPNGTSSKNRKVRGDVLVETSNGKIILVDLVICDPIIQYDDKTGKLIRGAAAINANRAKVSKYSKDYVFEEDQFCGFAIEAGGHWGEEAIQFVYRIAKEVQDVTLRSIDHDYTRDNICQRVSVAIQRGVAKRVFGRLNAIMNKGK